MRSSPNRLRVTNSPLVFINYPILFQHSSIKSRFPQSCFLISNHHVHRRYRPAFRDAQAPARRRVPAAQGRAHLRYVGSVSRAIAPTDVLTARTRHHWPGRLVFVSHISGPRSGDRREWLTHALQDRAAVGEGLPGARHHPPLFELQHRASASPLRGSARAYVARPCLPPQASSPAARRAGPGKFKLHYGDLSDSTNLVYIIAQVQPTEVYNLGAQSHVKVSFEMAEYTGDVDGLGTLRLLDAIRTCGLEKHVKFYQASTSELYGKVVETPQSETTPFYPRSPYGCAKLYAYWIVVNYREAYGMYACNGILFNHESPRRGRTFVTRKITRAAAEISLGKQSCLYLGNIDAQRDWGHGASCRREFRRYMRADAARSARLRRGHVEDAPATSGGRLRARHGRDAPRARVRGEVL